ncbi:MAG: PAS domain-containing protein [Synergistales bacterium]|nr:PAS domain-containing protein [Synergistales bacterium]
MQEESISPYAVAVDELRLLLVEDAEEDAELVVLTLESAGIQVEYHRVETEAELREALGPQADWDAVLIDYNLPGFSGLRALEVLRPWRETFPLILVSGAIGEEQAVEAMRAGAGDFVMKEHLDRLPLVVRREVREARERARREEAERALRSMEEKLQGVLEYSSALIYAADREGRYILASRSFAEHHGVGRDEVIGKTAYDLVPPDVADQLVARRRHVLQTGDVVTVDTRVPRDDGERCYLTTLFPLRESGGDIAAVGGIAVETTERMELERRLAGRQAQLQAVFDSIPDTVFFKDTDGVYTHANAAMEDFFGKPLGEIIGKNDEELFRAEEAREIREIDRHVLQGMPDRGEFVRYVNGTKRVVDTIKVPVRDEEGTIMGLCGSSRDVSEQVRSREELRNALDERDVLLKELYHRTKNNMQVIASMISMRRGRTENSEMSSVLHELEGKIYSMALVHQKLYQSGNLSRLDLKGYTEELARLVLGSFDERLGRTLLHFDCEHLEVTIDTAIPYGLVINELLSNALEHAFPDGRRGDISIALRKDGPGTIELTLADDGVGMPEGWRSGKGKTLGLETVTGVVEQQMEGSLGCTCPDEGGTIWTVRFSDSLYKERV